MVLHACDLLVQESLLAALSARGLLATAWHPLDTTCVPGQVQLLVLAGPVGDQPCPQGCSRGLVHWRTHHAAQPVVLLGSDHAHDDWAVAWHDSLDRLHACLEQAALGRRPSAAVRVAT